MEKKYLIGYLYGRELVMFDDVKNFQEIFDDDTGLTTIKFTDVDGSYEYKGNDHRGYKEVNRRGPDFTSYNLIGRRTAKRHDYFNQTDRGQDSIADRFDRTPNRFQREIGAGTSDSSSYYPCGWGPGAGCGGYHRTYGCGWSYGCGGGGC